ncbi:MAG: SUF system Fe-S cluster assembly regulator [Deltaproteobacteria bacterium]|nr:MAG: SUF system Fe-S cluster assembly regulator [Deltaproteobacteria bacterium]
MLRVTKLCDYAIVVLTEMARQAAPASIEGPAFAARDIAEMTGVPQPTVSKVLKQLVRARLLESRRGVNGGYRLARAPETITIADVISAIEGPIALTECAFESPNTCEREECCRVAVNWQRISDAVRRALAGITIADMTRPLPVPPLEGLEERDPSLVVIGDHGATVP